MKRIIFLNRYFPPDHSATSQILGDLAFHLAARGREVHVVASRQLYDQPQARLPAAETVEGVQIHRVATTRLGRTRLLGRALDYLSFAAAIRRAVLAIAAPGDILVAKTDPPLLCVVALRVARQRDLHLVNWLQDLYPEVAARLGVPLAGGALGAGLMRLRDVALREAAANIAVGDGMARIVCSRGVSPERVHVIPNWCDDEQIRPLPSSVNPLRRKWGLEDRFVVGYSGNLGRAHEFDTLLAAAERLRDRPNILFLFIGGGSKFDDLIRAVGQRRLSRSFRFVPYQDRGVLGFSLTVPDVHWLSLLPRVEGLMLPSKLYGIAAAGRPLVAVTARDGEIAGLVRRYECGVVVESGEGDDLAAELSGLADDPAQVAAMGSRARQMLEANFTRRQAFERWRSVLDAIG
jgi:glycosyltransferase involved in cell wall biosynthesis